MHIFRHLFVCFQTSVYTLGEFHKNRNNSTVFEELSVSIVELTVANICFNGSASRRQYNCIGDLQIHNWHRQLFKYSAVNPYFPQHWSTWTYSGSSCFLIICNIVFNFKAYFRREPLLVFRNEGNAIGCDVNICLVFGRYQDPWTQERQLAPQHIKNNCSCSRCSCVAWRNFRT